MATSRFIYRADKVESVLRSADVEELLSMGAPADEYNAEAKNIAVALGALQPDPLIQDKIIAVIALIWAKSFALDETDIKKRMPAFRHIAERLLTIIE